MIKPEQKQQPIENEGTMKKEMKVLIGDTIYYVIARVGNEVCVLQTLKFTNTLKKQLKIWTSEYKEVK